MSDIRVNVKRGGIIHKCSDWSTKNQWTIEKWLGLGIMVKGLIALDSNIVLFGWVIHSIGVLGQEQRDHINY